MRFAHKIGNRQWFQMKIRNNREQLLTAVNSIFACNINFDKIKYNRTLYVRRYDAKYCKSN